MILAVAADEEEEEKENVLLDGECTAETNLLIQERVNITGKRGDIIILV